VSQDSEHLQLLAIFHYVIAGLAALLSFFPLFYSIIGGFLLYAAQHPGPSNQQPPPAFLGGLFIAVGAVLFLAGVTTAICILIAGRCLFRRKGHSFALVIACIECLFVPFGTILGVFTIVALSQESVKALFEVTQTMG
jgi:ABC-type branched-subunit amino acid transport system permease subunit